MGIKAAMTFFYHKNVPACPGTTLALNEREISSKYSPGRPRETQMLPRLLVSKPAKICLVGSDPCSTDISRWAGPLRELLLEEYSHMLQYLAAGLCVTLIVPVVLVKCMDKDQSSICQVKYRPFNTCRGCSKHDIQEDIHFSNYSQCSPACWGLQSPGISCRWESRCDSSWSITAFLVTL